MRGAVGVISSHVARGSVGNRAAVFALEALGHAVVAVPTVILPWHPGHGAGTARVPLSDADFPALLRDLANGPFSGELTALLSGYLVSPAQVSAVAEMVDRLRFHNRDFVYCCDPVIGDEGGLYVPEAVARAVAGELVPRADILTPNRFELAWLTGLAVNDNAQLIAAARASGVATVLATSAFAMLRGSIANLLVSGDDIRLAEHRRLAAVPHGTGDLTAGLFLAHIVGGAAPADALQRTTASVQDLLMRTARRGADELTLAADAEALVRPMAPVAVRRIVTGPLDKPA